MGIAAARRTAPCALALALLAASAIAFPALAQERQCPQPRFTGKAPHEYYNRASPLAPGAENSIEAERLYQDDDRSVSCATCHGKNGNGKGPMARQFKPPPRDFTCAQTINGVLDGQLFWIIRFGSPGTSMPPHPKLSDNQIWNVVAYLRKLAK